MTVAELVTRLGAFPPELEVGLLGAFSDVWHEVGRVDRVPTWSTHEVGSPTREPDMVWLHGAPRA